MIMFHQAVLLHESVQGLHIQPKGIYVDATFGGGGHARAILRQLSTGRLLAFDQDQDVSQNLLIDERFTFIPHNFKYLKNFLQLYNAIPVDGILADLGVSSHQFDTAEKGFSFRADSRLDMRMDSTNPTDAYQVVNQYEESELKRIFRLYGELPQAAKLAHQLTQARIHKPIATTFELRDIAVPLFPIGKENKHLAQLFQAIRMEVNAEVKALESFLIQAIQLLRPGGRLVVISYHSIEDRMVKNFIRSGNASGVVEKDFFGNNLSPMKAVGRLIVPSETEIEQNSRARSAKLRIGEKIAK
ncbi:MAG: 16S rRNA (cytosine(1402)-N(4))-methyltransferase RsmH [Bacteroidales bacterium]|jgi:16S rRNA (cytosine1402-N4)-methyltransferase|nr:16S rRNA (cytosine(1402)-N(4))-methyltransferase RsmH [Bacteroidales bacterium]MCK9448102.1 16S rRNA (cytosine(1402)-N(4))-methyltransferase RsmH [Bacteroidales bacterium]MDD3701242.1 16S rRNA (cytosine(1402)-N(4))-methyltransferase RsmH [Bacteroidales bacterium]MDY0368372.1 16S rRNA (cytosine(1402)-N(4))-methyltransferase RsmH [Bacteroidales bacterium]